MSKRNVTITVYTGNEAGVQYYSPQDEMMAVAELYAFEDNLRAGLTMQAIRNTTLLAQAALEPMGLIDGFKSYKNTGVVNTV